MTPQTDEHTDKQKTGMSTCRDRQMSTQNGEYTE
jgi:hypothetical protein